MLIDADWVPQYMCVSCTTCVSGYDHSGLLNRRVGRSIGPDQLTLGVVSVARCSMIFGGALLRSIARSSIAAKLAPSMLSIAIAVSFGCSCWSAAIAAAFAE